MNIPTILESQEPIVKWAREQRIRYINLCSIVALLVSDKPWKTSPEIEEIRKLYDSKNSYWRDAVLIAIVMDSYQLENDFKKGDVVSNGDMIGYAGELDFANRSFTLWSDASYFNSIGGYKMDDFTKFDKNR